MSIVGSEQWMYSSGAAGFYDFPIDQSLRFEDGDSAYLSRTPSSAGTQTTYTLSMWFKCGNIKDMMLFGAGSSTSNQTYIRLYGSANQAILWETDTGATTDWYVRTNALLRDPSAWYHLVFVFDNSLSGITNKAKIYINGELASIAASSGDYPSGYVNAAVPHYIGRSASTTYTDGYMAEVNFIDGQALDPTSFGETKSGIWIPKDTSGLTYGTNGFRLNFADTVEASGFNAVTYTGNQTDSHAISGVGFSSSPDFVWIKERSSTSSHLLVDSVRGASKGLASNATTADENLTAGEFSSFDSDGFTVDNNNRSNQSGQTYVAWCWDAGTGSAASNTDGSITSTVKANTDYGFSIVSYTGNGTAGATVGHGLGVTAPDMYIVKSRDNARDWRVYHSSLGATQALQLNKTDAANTSSAFWNNTEPTSSVFSIGNVTTVNGSGEDYIAYCFAEKAGYSKFGTYTGTGAAGNSITGLGFKPAFLLAKRTDTTGNWGMWDNTRDTEGTITKYLVADLSNAEGDASSVGVDFDDDGFTFQGGSAVGNGSGGTYIYMAFADTRDAAFWRDVSGQGNDWQHNNLTFSDVVPDGTNNFATFSPVDNAQGATLSEGNLKAVNSGAANDKRYHATFGMTTGKWYWEVKIVSQGARNWLGIYSDEDSSSASLPDNYALIVTGNSTSATTGTNNTTVPAFTSGDIVTFAFDADNGNLYYGKNATPTIGATADFSDLASDTYLFGVRETSTASTNHLNTGADSTFAGLEAAGGNADENGYGDFAYAPPSGFLSLCSANLPSGAIDTLNDETPEDYFNTVLYTGDGNTGRTVTGVGFQPDFAWIKERSSTSSHILSNAIAGSTKLLSSNTTDAEATDSNKITSFDSDGYTLGSSGAVNQSSQTYVGWNWKAGGAGVSNTDGSITSTVSVGATSQQNWFSIVGYTGNGTAGATVGHGLERTPDWVVVKDRDNGSTQWVHNPFGAYGSNQYIYFDTQGITADSNIFWNGNPNSTTIGLDDHPETNANGTNYIAYCFANAEGLCKVGSYTGNGSADGTFIFTGFRPSLVLVKQTNTTRSWGLWDNKRVPYNENTTYLLPNSNIAEEPYADFDFLSNGFKARNDSALHNQSGGSYIYLAIAEQPFKYANAR